MNELYCLRCHDKMGIPICGACRRPIEERVVTALGKHWHVEHFVCAKCEKPFLGHRHYEKRGLAYCETHYHQLFGNLCFVCNQVIGGDGKYQIIYTNKIRQIFNNIQFSSFSQYSLLWIKPGAFITLPALFAIKNSIRNRNSTNMTKNRCAKNAMNASPMNCVDVSEYHMRIPWRNQLKLMCHLQMCPWYVLHASTPLCVHITRIFIAR